MYLYIPYVYPHNSYVGLPKIHYPGRVTYIYRQKRQGQKERKKEKKIE